MKIEDAKGDKWKKLKIIKKKNENKMFQKEWILKNDRSEKKIKVKSEKWKSRKWKILW